MKHYTDEQFQHMLEHSYKNFHAKGFDYLCLHRTDEITEKVYFFRGQSEKLHEVVNPHDHRYNFYSKCLSGVVENHTWVRNNADYGMRFDAFLFDTPLKGGRGFSPLPAPAYLLHKGSEAYVVRQTYWMSHTGIHTISVKPDTVLKQWQFEDCLPAGAPTRTYTRNPDTLWETDDGLYEKFKPDELLQRLCWLEEIT